MPGGAERRVAEVERLRGRIADSSLADAATLHATLATLDEAPRAEAVAAVVETLAAAGDHDPALRERALWFAKERNGPELFPVWRAVLLREQPRTQDEAEVLARGFSSHRHDDFRALTAEQVMAVSAIGALLSQHDAAETLLLEVAQGRRDVPGRLTLLRLESARQLQAHDPNGLLKLARLLPAGDPLRGELANHARARRSQP